MAYVEAIDFDFAAFWRNALSLFRTTVIQGIMPNYLRYRLKGGCYFFTVNLLERNSTLLVDHIDLLRESVRLCKQKRPFYIDTWVVLPEHMRCI